MDRYPLPARSRQSSLLVWRDLDALWYREESGKKVVHGSSAIRAAVSPNRENLVRVGVFEEHAGATGVQWRTSVWIAAFQASLALGRPLTAHRFNISVGGFIDGPSAGALMATGFLAAMTGAPVRRDATITGGLVPGGALGPVDGIPAKIRAAKELGKRALGIPYGQATVLDFEGNTVDAVALGRSLGVEVRELRDLHDAYRLMTGRELRRVRPVSRVEMALAPVHTRRVMALARRMIAEAQRQEARLREDRAGWSRPVHARLRGLLHRTQDAIAARSSSRSYFWAREAAAVARAAEHLRSLSGNGAALPLVDLVEQGEAELEGVKKELDTAAVAPTGVTVTLVEAYASLARARGYLEVARGIEEAPAASRTRGAARGAGALGRNRAGAASPRPRVPLQNEKGRKLLVATYLGRAQLALQRVRDALTLGRVEPAHGRPWPLGLKLAARSFASAASGNVEFVDALLLRQVAEDTKKSLKRVRDEFARRETSYLAAGQLVAIVLDRGLTPPTLPGTLFRLGSATNAYVESSLVIAKYYSLDVTVPPGGGPPQCGRPEPLAAMLANADRDAREAAAQVRAQLGVIPPAARLHYQAGLHLARGDLNSKLHALAELWRSMVASTAVRLVMQPER